MAGVTGENAREAQLKMQMIFQDNGAALNPRMRIVDIIGEAPVLHGLIGVRQQIEYVGLQLNRVGMDPTLMRRLPHQFPAAHRLRIAIARALAVKPELLVLDEPLAMLDVSMRAQLENLLLDLRTALALTYVHITRDLALARHASERVMIMYRGRIVELGPTQEVLVLPNHPYTRALVLAEKLEVDEKPAADNGRAPSRNGTASGCVFRSHCPYAMPRCEEASPPLEQIAPGRWSACYLNTSP